MVEATHLALDRLIYYREKTKQCIKLWNHFIEFLENKNILLLYAFFSFGLPPTIVFIIDSSADYFYDLMV